MLTATRRKLMQGDATAPRPDQGDGPVNAGARASNAYERLYLQLLELARARWKSERKQSTLQATAVANEVFLRLGNFDPRRFADERALRSFLGGAIRNFLLEYAARRNRDQRGGQWRRVELDEALAAVEDRVGWDLEALELALRELALHDREQCQVVELRFFEGLTYAEIGQTLGVSARVAESLWVRGRDWLHGKLSRGGRARD